MSHRIELMRFCLAFLLSPTEALSRMKLEPQALKSEGLRKPTGE